MNNVWRIQFIRSTLSTRQRRNIFSRPY